MISRLRPNYFAVLLTVNCLVFVDTLLAEETFAGRLYVAPGATVNSSDEDRIAEGDLEYNFAVGYYVAERWAMEMRAFGGSYDLDEDNFDYLGATLGLTYMPFRHRQWGNSFSYVLPPFLADLGKPFLRLAAGQIETDTLVETESNSITEVGLGLDILPKNKIWYLRGEFILRQEDTGTEDFKDQLINVSWVLPFGKIYRLNLTSYDPEEKSSINTRNEPTSQAEPTPAGPTKQYTPPKINKEQASQPRPLGSKSSHAAPSEVAGDQSQRTPIYTPPAPQTVHAKRPTAPSYSPPPIHSGTTNINTLNTNAPSQTRQPIPRSATVEQADNHPPAVFELDPNKPNLLARLSFKYRTSDLTEDSMAALDQIIVLLNQDPTMRINLFGYTDNRGDLLYNLQISKKRAESARDYLIYKGVPTNKIVSVEGKGPANPIANNNLASGRAKNRRVEVERM